MCDSTSPLTQHQLWMQGKGQILMYYTYSHHAETCTLYLVVSEYCTRALLNIAHIHSTHDALHELTKNTTPSLISFGVKWFKNKLRHGSARNDQTHVSSNWHMNNVWILYPSLKLVLLQFPAMRDGLDTTDYAWWIISCQRCAFRLHIIWCADKTLTQSLGGRLLYNIVRWVLNMERWSFISNLSNIKFN